MKKIVVIDFNSFPCYFNAPTQGAPNEQRKNRFFPTYGIPASARFPQMYQHLRIKAFFGTSENAVKTQVWIAISIYVLVAIVKKELSLKKSLYEILQILSVTVFEKDQLFQALMEKDTKNEQPQNDKQLMLFNL